MDFKLIFANMFILILIYYMFKLFDEKYRYCKAYTLGYWLGFIGVFILPLIFVNLICFFSLPLWVALAVFYLATISIVFYWYGFKEYNKERLIKEGIKSNNFWAQNPKMFTAITFFPVIIFTIAIILIVFLK